MITIRPFQDSDGQMMLEIEELCPQGDERYAVGAKKTDFIARYRMYDNWKLMVAEEEGQLIGWTGWTAKNTMGKPYVYLAEVNVLPDFRRRGVAGRLTAVAEDWARNAGADHIYCYIFQPNSASKSLFKAQGYSHVLDARICEKGVYKEAKIPEGFRIDRLRYEDLPEAVALLNSYNAGYMHYESHTPESFLSRLNAIPGYGQGNYWVVRDRGRIVACAGLWDSSSLWEMCYAREPFRWKLAGGIMRLLEKFTRVPKIPAEGEYFKVQNIADHAFDSGYADGMRALLGHLNNHLLENGRNFFVEILDESDPQFKIIEELKPQIETWEIYAKPLQGKLTGFSPFSVDIRDMIP